MVAKYPGSCLSHTESWNLGSPAEEAIIRFEIRDHSKAAEGPGVLEGKPKWMAWPEASAKNSKSRRSARGRRGKGLITTIVSSSTASRGEVDSSQTNKATEQYLNVLIVQMTRRRPRS